MSEGEDRIISRFEADKKRRSRQAALLWATFIMVDILINGTILFVLRIDLRAWTYSIPRSILFGLLIYGGLFLAVPLVLVKGWVTVRQPAFYVPLLLAMLALGLWEVYRGTGVVVVLVLAYLHWRFDLSELGFRTRGWKGDLVAILLIAFLGVLPGLLRPAVTSFDIGKALLAGLDRLFTNPASSVEALFYFGFIAEGLSYKTGRWLTPPLVGLMYAGHEMANPEYWYEGMNFVFVFIGVTIITMIYLWRRNVVAVWLGDGLRRVFTGLI